MMNVKCVPIFGGNLHQTRYAYVQQGAGKKLNLLIIDPMQETVLERISFNSGKDFDAAIRQHFSRNQIHAAIFDIFDYVNHGYDSVGRLIELIRFKLNQLRVPNYFIPTYELLCSSVLVAANNVFPSNGNRIFLIGVDNDEYQIGKFLYTKDGYKREGYICYDIKANESPAVTYKNILDSFELSEPPKYIVAWGLYKNVKFDAIRNVFKSNTITTVSLQDVHEARIKYLCIIAPFIIRKCETLFSSLFNLNYFIPTLPEDYVALGMMGTNLFTIHKFEQSDDLPAKTTIVLPRTVQQCAVIIPRCTGNDFLASIKFNANVHKNEFEFFIDVERTIKYKITEVILPEIKSLPKSLNTVFKKKAKIPIIGYFDNSSVICVPDKAGNYNFMDEWNGIYGQELFINFAQKQPQFGIDVVKAVSTKMEYVVFDLLKIMSMPANDIKVDDEKWKFTFTENCDHPILIEFENFDGKKSAQTPQFLMAMLLKEHNKVIKNKCGKKPNELGFCFFDDFSDVERKRVEEGLTESCKLLKQECKFIKF